MNDEQPTAGRHARRAAAVVAGAVAAGMVGEALEGTNTTNTTDTTDAAATATVVPEAQHEWVPEASTSTVTHGADGSTGVSTGTTWQPAGEAQPGQDVPSITEFETIEVREDALGNFVIDATEQVVVHEHGHDTVYEDHQQLTVPGDGTPGGTDLTVTEQENVAVQENLDGTISVTESGSLTVGTQADASDGGTVEVWQEESVTLDDPPADSAAHDPGVSEQEQAAIDDPFGASAGGVIHQQEGVGDRRTAGTPPPPPAPVVSPPPAFTVVSTPDSGQSIMAAAQLAPPPPERQPAPEPKTVTHHDFGSHVTAPPHDPGELAGPATATALTPVATDGSHDDPGSVVPDGTPTGHESDQQPSPPLDSDTQEPEQQHDDTQSHPALDVPGHDYFDQAHG